MLVSRLKEDFSWSRKHDRHSSTGTTLNQKQSVEKAKLFQLNWQLWVLSRDNNSTPLDIPSCRVTSSSLSPVMWLENTELHWNQTNYGQEARYRKSNVFHAIALGSNSHKVEIFLYWIRFFTCRKRNENKFLEIIDVLKLLTDYSFAVTTLIGLNQVFSLVWHQSLSGERPTKSLWDRERGKKTNLAN